MFNGFHSMGAGGWVLMALFWVALLAVVVWLVARLFPTGAEDRQRGDGGAGDAREILDRRLAGGEIDVQSYELLRSKLGPRSLAGRG